MPKHFDAASESTHLKAAHKVRTQIFPSTLSSQFLPSIEREPLVDTDVPGMKETYLFQFKRQRNCPFSCSTLIVVKPAIQNYLAGV